MDASTFYGNGSACYVSEEYEEALKQHVCAVTLQDCAEHRNARAATYLKLGKFSEALQDADAALAFQEDSYMALHWRGVALFYMGDYQSAKLAFESSLKANPGAKAPRQMWLRKCEAELSGSTLPLGGVVSEAPKGPLKQPTAPPASAAASAAPAVAAPAVQAPTVTEAPAEKSGLSISGRKPIKREWYQSDSSVFVTLFAKHVPQDKLKVNFTEKELSVSFPLPGAEDEEYQLDLELFDAIDPASSKFEVSSLKVELVLAKKRVLQWKDLEKVDVVQELPTPAQPAYPTSNKAKRNWSQIDKEVESELKDEKGAGDEALNALFRQIYERADEDTRRAMNKSFQTSGGTVLSTNWGEVASADYEGKDRPTPPDGQEWRDWRAEKK